MTAIPPNVDSHTNVLLTLAEGLRSAGKLGSYLELGVHKGCAFNKIAPIVGGSAYAVDTNANTFPHIKHNKNLRWYCGKSEDFLANYDGEQLDFVFIDGDHKHEASLSDFTGVLPYVSNNGLIVLHDTYPPNLAFTRPGRCIDTYKTADYIRRNIDHVESVTLPFYYGLTIVRNCNTQLAWDSEL